MHSLCGRWTFRAVLTSYTPPSTHTHPHHPPPPPPPALPGDDYITVLELGWQNRRVTQGQDVQLTDGRTEWCAGLLGLSCVSSLNTQTPHSASTASALRNVLVRQHTKLKVRHTQVPTHFLKPDFIPSSSSSSIGLKLLHLGPPGPHP